MQAAVTSGSPFRIMDAHGQYRRCRVVAAFDSDDLNKKVDAASITTTTASPPTHNTPIVETIAETTTNDTPVHCASYLKNMHAAVTCGDLARIDDAKNHYRLCLRVASLDQLYNKDGATTTSQQQQ